MSSLQPRAVRAVYRSINLICTQNTKIHTEGEANDLHGKMKQDL